MISDMIEKKTEMLNDMSCTMIKAFDDYIDNGIEHIDADEAMKMSDIIKDLCEAEKDKMKCLYYHQVIMAMENADSKAYTERDMDRPIGRMYYTPKEQIKSRYDMAKRGYEETKHMNADSTMVMQSLENYMDTISHEIDELIGEMDSNEKAMIRNKMNVIMNKIH